MEIHVEIPNLERIQAALMQSPGIVAKHINKAISRSMLDLRNSAIDTTPKNKARLVGSYQVTTKGLRGEIQPTAKYAYWVHEGTGIYVGHTKWRGKIPGVGWRWIRGQKGNPYLKNAVNRTQGKINTNFETGLSDALIEVRNSAS